MTVCNTFIVPLGSLDIALFDVALVACLVDGGLADGGCSAHDCCRGGFKRCNVNLCDDFQMLLSREVNCWVKMLFFSS